MARTPENINFCIFVECSYLTGEECTIEECVFSKKSRNWWEWYLVKGLDVKSAPPDGKKRLLNIYYDPDIGEYVFEREE